MTENSVLTHRNVGVLAVEAVDAPEVVTSAWIDDQLAETYERTGLKPGTLTDLAGIEERRWWPEGVTFDEAAAMAGRAALDAAGIDPQRVGMLISTSVCKHHLEPSVACAVHHRLQLAPSCLNFDVGNACLGFINGMQIAAAAIDAGPIDYALIVDGEGSRYTQETTIDRLQQPTTEAADVFAEFASLTLGSGAAAAVLCRFDEHPEAHRLVGGIARSGTQHHELCVGDLDRMTTDTHGLLVAGLDLAEAAWKHSGARLRLGVGHGLVHRPPGQPGPHPPDHRASRDRSRQGAADLPEVRQRRAGGNPDHAGEVGRPDPDGRPRAVHGHRVGAQHELHRNRLVTPPTHPIGDVTSTDATPDIPDAATWRRWGLDPAWSRSIDVASHEGGTHRWHVLDTGVARHDPDAPTVVCVHGNPTWAYAWATFLRRLHESYRVVAVDQLGMGYSERTPMRRYVDRVRDLDDVIVALDIGRNSPLVLAAHDWGGAIAMGWAVQDPKQVAGMILCNTGIAVPEGRSAPGIIRLAASASMLELVCHGTSTFVEGTVRLSGRRISKIDREAFRAPYRGAPGTGGDRRLRRRHPAPSRSPVGSGDRRGRRSARVGHGPGAAGVGRSRTRCSTTTSPTTSRPGSRTPHCTVLPARTTSSWPKPTSPGWPRPGWRNSSTDGFAAVPNAASADRIEAALWAALEARRDDDAEAFVDMATGDSVSFDDLAERVDAIASELHRHGLRPGDHVAMLTPPGVDLVAAVYGVWRAGGVTVIADRGLGLRGLGRAVRSARPKFVIGPRQARLAATSLRWAPRATPLDVAELVTSTAGAFPPLPAATIQRPILFTSGATGPAKGVRYRHRQLAAQRDALASTYAITDADRLVAAFAPFALYGPALGIPTALPDVDVTKPGELTAAALDAACARVGATLAFASPAALANVVATAEAGARHTGLAGLRVVFSAGAPVPSETLRAIGALAPAASLHTPYGMTEVLPVADIELGGDRTGRTRRSRWRCVCRTSGRRCRGAHRGARFRRRGTSAPSSRPARRGRSSCGRRGCPTAISGCGRPNVTPAPAPRATGIARATSAISTRSDGCGSRGGRPRDPRSTVRSRSVPVERLVERSLGLRRVAAVGVGPLGIQQLVVVIEDPAAPDGPADSGVTAAVREAVSAPVASVLTASKLPVDIRHNAKIDRALVASWASDLLAGRRAKRLTRRW